MPELPEVEITRQGLLTQLPGQPVLQQIKFFRKDLRWELPKKAQKIVPGQRLMQIRRRGKYLIFEFEKSILISHLGMSGHWRKAGDFEKLKTHDHVEFNFGKDQRFLFNDPRRFGFLDYLEDSMAETEYFKNMGFEPLDSDWPTVDLWTKLKKQNRDLKVALMDQKNIVGVGNIYASESLFLAKLSPFLKTSKLTLQQVEELRRQVVFVLKKSIASGGSSIQDFAHTTGVRGHFQDQFLVYDREGLACSLCQSEIQFQNLGGRATYWCNQCQSVPKKKLSKVFTQKRNALISKKNL